MSPLSVDRAPSRDRSSYLAMMPQLERRGFLRIPVDLEMRKAADHVFMLANTFFARPAAEKYRYANPAWVEGYREMGPEYALVPERPDLTESFSVWNHTRMRPNLDAWAVGCPLHGALRRASDLLGDVVRDLFAAMADYFQPGAPELRFFRTTHVQLNFYEPAKHSRDLLQDSHEDGHLVTMVSTNAPGLEIEVDGEFIPAGVDKDQLLVMPGSLLSLMTGYRVKPLYHRVVNTHRADPRCSMLYFVNPEIDQQLTPWITNDSNRGVDVIERANLAPKKFGLPTLEETLAGKAGSRVIAGAAQ
ncbi:2OG-Fe(II) oxygenase family protein [Dongia deserti]|uniref:2OG-Fe(II) oxygenase family protein n=1 Tax=Dongia deserti TaxID=2268030 RepID=UPI000E65ABE8|nr:2OG-Fe(II) oxygenase family protein [Dongia deserti]